MWPGLSRCRFSLPMKPLLAFAAPTARAGRGLTLLTLGAALCWPLALSLRAVDPLPPEIQAASPAVQAQYLERRGQESEAQRKEAAQQRYEQKLEMRQAMITGMVKEADSRRAELAIEAASGASAVPAELDETRMHPLARPSFWRNLGLLLLACALVYHFRDRLFRRLHTAPARSHLPPRP